MNLPDPPPSYREPAGTERAWSWRIENEAGETVEVSEEFTGQRFATQADAESWVGEVWADLADEGADAVSLFEHDRLVYGPMSLHA